MTDILIETPQGIMLSVPQALRLVSLVEEMGSANCHWHENDCVCCITLHGPDCAYVIGRDGDDTFFADRGCDCQQEGTE